MPRAESASSGSASPVEGIFRASLRKLRDAHRLLAAQPRVVVLFSVAGLGLFVLAADAIGLRNLADSVGVSALFSIAVAFPTYLVTAAAGTGLAWHADRDRAGLPRRPVPAAVMRRGATSNARRLAGWAVVAGVVNAVAALRVDNAFVDTAIEIAATFWQMLASSVVAYVVVFRHDLSTAVGRGVERTRLTWRERLVRMFLVDVTTVVALLVAVLIFLVAGDLEADDPFTAALLATFAAVLVVLAVAWSSALRFAVNIAGRVDELRREAATGDVGEATRRAGPDE